MEYVDWVQSVLRATARAAEENIHYGFADRVAIATNLFGQDFAQGPTFWQSDQHLAMMDALDELTSVGVLGNGSTPHYRKVTRNSQIAAENPRPLWTAVLQGVPGLRPEEDQLLRVVVQNGIRPHDSPEYAFCLREWVSSVTVADALGWDRDAERRWELRMRHLSSGLSDLRLLQQSQTIGPPLSLRATYKGVVRVTKADELGDSMKIDGYLAAGENSSVELKRRLDLDSNDGKAEFVKDIIALANTQSPEPHLLMVGFDDKTKTYVAGPASGVTQDRIEDISHAYISPFLNVRWSVVQYRSGLVGLLQVLREPHKLPYKVKKSLAGSTRKIEVDTIFVRHGSHVAQPDAEELAAIHEEAARHQRNSGA